MHKFILAENPQVPERGSLWIVHLLNPICIIEAVLDGEKIHTKKAIYKSDFQYKNSDGIVENWQLRVHHYFTTDFDERKEAEFLCEKIMIEAWHWYESYLKWEEDNINNE